MPGLDYSVLGDLDILPVQISSTIFLNKNSVLYV